MRTQKLNNLQKIQNAFGRGKKDRKCDNVKTRQGELTKSICTLALPTPQAG
jgi:hypothetical protein